MRGMDGEPQRPSLRGDRFLAHRGLIALCCGTAMAEAFVLIVVAPGARALAPQVTALPPLAIFHDLRWLYSTQRSWLWFGLLLAGLLVARSTLNMAMIRLAWPAHLTPPLAALRAALVVTTLACLLISPLVSLTFGVAILPFSWPFLALLPAMLLIALPLSHAGLAGTWWRTLPPVSAAWWLLAEFCVLTAAAAVSTALPPPDAVPIAGLAGLVNARAWYGLTAAIARPAQALADGQVPADGQALADGRAQAGPLRPAPALAGAGAELATPATHRVPAGPMGVAAVLATVIALTRLVFVFGGPAATGHPQAAVAWVTGASGAVHATATAGHDPVLEVAGFGSWCCGQDRALAKALPGTVVQQFSYLGTTRGGQPLPYGSKASDLPLPLLGDRIAAQVWRLHEQTGKPVDIVAESEGSLGLDAMLARHPDVPLGSVVLLSPIVAPGQSGYHGAGSGLVTRDELHALIWFVGGLSPFGTTGAQTFINSVNSVGARFAAAAARHAPVRLLEVIPLADAVTLPACPLPRNVVIIPAFHGELLGDPAALRTVRRFLTDRSVAGVPSLRATAEIMAAAATAWRMPESAAPCAARLASGPPASGRPASGRRNTGAGHQGGHPAARPHSGARASRGAPPH
jgi:hypothetical protein